MDAILFQTYIVILGDTFESIAKKMFGDPCYAEKIAYENGMADSYAPKPGLLLYLPQIINERYTSDTSSSRPYHLFLDYITGNLLPRLAGVLPVHRHHRHHSSFLKNIIKIVAVGIILAIAPELGGVVLGLAGIAITPLTSTIAAMVAGALMDAAVQGLAIETGIQSKFSFAEVIESSVSAGFGGGFKTPDSLLSAAKTALYVGTAQVATQLAEMAAGIRSKLGVSFELCK